jgi:hypothetical protein
MPRHQDWPATGAWHRCARRHRSPPSLAAAAHPARSARRLAGPHARGTDAARTHCTTPYSRSPVPRPPGRVTAAGGSGRQRPAPAAARQHASTAASWHPARPLALPPTRALDRTLPATAPSQSISSLVAPPAPASPKSLTPQLPPKTPPISQVLCTNPELVPRPTLRGYCAHPYLRRAGRCWLAFPIGGCAAVRASNTHALAAVVPAVHCRPFARWACARSRPRAALGKPRDFAPLPPSDAAAAPKNRLILFPSQVPERGRLLWRACCGYPAPVRL